MSIIKEQREEAKKLIETLSPEWTFHEAELGEPAGIWDANCDCVFAIPWGYRRDFGERNARFAELARVMLPTALDLIDQQAARVDGLEEENARLVSEVARLKRMLNIPSSRCGVPGHSSYCACHVGGGDD